VAKRGGPSVIDGLASVRAAQHAGRGAQGPRLRPSRTRLPAADKPPEAPRKPRGSGPASRIGHTAIPPRNEIVCYVCGYAFVLQGKIEKTYCPKCRHMLEMKHFVLEDEVGGVIRTIGTIEITERAKIGADAELVGGRIVVAGDARPARLRAGLSVEIRPGGRLEMERTTAPDLIVAPGGRFASASPVSCRNLTVSGEARARFSVEGLALVRPGGALCGEIRGARLVVEEGGGLKARVSVAKSEGANKR